MYSDDIDLAHSSSCISGFLRSGKRNRNLSLRFLLRFLKKNNLKVV